MTGAHSACKTDTIAIYEELYKKVSLRGNYTFKGTDSELTIINKFVEWFISFHNNTYSPEILRKFIEIQFNHYLFTPTPYGRGCVVVSWCFGKKAIDRFKEKYSVDNRMSTRHHVGKKLKSTITLDNNNTRYSVKVNRRDIVETNENEESEKSRFHNSTKGYVWCTMYTTLYNHKSSLCSTCNHRENCKQELRDSYPNLYKIRGYNSNE